MRKGRGISPPLRVGRLLGALLLLGASVAGGDDLGGQITSGKAKKLADEGSALMKQADEIFKRWVLDQIPEKELLAELERGIELYDAGAAKLQAALDIQEDGAVLHRLQVGAKRLQKMRFTVHFRLRPQVKARPLGPKPGTVPTPAEPAKPEPATPEPTNPEPATPETATPEPAKPEAREPGPAPGAKPTLEDDDQPGPNVEFVAAQPPSQPSLVELPTLPMDDAERAAALKHDKKGIEALIKDYLGARKVGKLTYRHKLCRGKGVFRDGSPCTECAGTGERINLHRFRKAYWNAFTPLLRDAPGALDALRGYYQHASAQLDALGPQVKAFKIEEIEHHGFWAKVTVAIRTTAGDETVAWTVVGIGSNWYFYSPASDGDLVPRAG